MKTFRLRLFARRNVCRDSDHAEDLASGIFPRLLVRFEYAPRRAGRKFLLHHFAFAAGHDAHIIAHGGLGLRLIVVELRIGVAYHLRPGAANDLQYAVIGKNHSALPVFGVDGCASRSHDAFKQRRHFRQALRAEVDGMREIGVG